MKSSIENGTKIALVSLTILGAAGFALAQPSGGPAEIIQYRQQHLKQLGGAMRAVSQQARSATPDLSVVRTNAETAKKLAAEMPSWFPEGTGPAAGVPTQAKAEIWSDRAGFEARVKQLQSAAESLGNAAGGSDVPAIAAAARALAGACQACHNQFRVEQQRSAPPAAPST